MEKRVIRIIREVSIINTAHKKVVLVKEEIDGVLETKDNGKQCLYTPYEIISSYFKSGFRKTQNELVNVNGTWGNVKITFVE